MDLRNKKVTVVGLGRSGAAAANLLAAHGAAVSVTEAADTPQVRETAAGLAKKGIAVETNKHSEDFIAGRELVVVSPGVPSQASPLLWAGQRGIPVISEIELAFRFCPAPVIAVTGTNGKTTVTTLIGEIFRQAGRETVVCGNIGNPFSGEVQRLNPFGNRLPAPARRAALGVAARSSFAYAQDTVPARTDNVPSKVNPLTRSKKIVVLEVSSFQLERIDSFKPALSIILNIAPDHLDRYAGLEEYRKAKFRIFENQTPDDRLILNFDDPLLRALKGQTEASQLFFSTRGKPPFHSPDILFPPLTKGGLGGFKEKESPRQRQTGGIKGAGYLADGKLFLGFEGKAKEICAVDEVKLKGEHNLNNLLAASLAARAFGVDEENIARALKSFPGLEHRFEEVARVRGVTFINDSKATNVEAAIEALKTCAGKVILVAGGQDKGLDYGAARKEIEEKVRIMILIGEARERIKAGLKGAAEIVEAEDLKRAVRMACGFAHSGETVLLSPMCASFDSFSSYAERGTVFKEAVNKLKIKGYTLTGTGK